MNFKKNWKRFWTLSRASEGFTLVELIVVIAIMAILAGV
ncbi:MAG: prepilin-type N-terminal cleavage/methylation domain-containing protein, partial [Oscillospiraceae bacterium]|nr:prepilin-type N-terminal cleavage/methylation domain-containing protein [Oscillospiraceae bacterium]MBQ2928113.1 prepilin-type N-terminal cleavage/methylation domain-containing protein [Oscillospiraceae bacterium]